MVTYEDHEPLARLIDFGNSTKIGRRSPYRTRSDWRMQVRRYPWGAAEFFRGEALDERADVVGLAYCLWRVSSLLELGNPQLPAMVGRGRAWVPDARPSVEAFISYLEDTLACLESWEKHRQQ